MLAEAGTGGWALVPTKVRVYVSEVSDDACKPGSPLGSSLSVKTDLRLEALSLEQPGPCYFPSDSEPGLLAEEWSPR